MYTRYGAVVVFLIHHSRIPVHQHIRCRVFSAPGGQLQETLANNLSFLCDVVIRILSDHVRYINRKEKTYSEEKDLGNDSVYRFIIIIIFTLSFLYYINPLLPFFSIFSLPPLCGLIAPLI